MTVPPPVAGRSRVADRSPIADQPVRTPDWDRAIADLLTGAGTLTLVAQPILNLGDGVVAGYELPSRFAGPPTAAPDVWFAEAHRLGSAGALTALVLRRVRRAMVPVGV